ncbi:MAG TPA: hypothetical protein VFO39_10540 [Candidatus Sulfotelmatobacter sp.]|nr:hypothetical protein [Candidatus Sulfotelmatobacter sp.]
MRVASELFERSFNRFLPVEEGYKLTGQAAEEHHFVLAANAGQAETTG